MAPLTKVLNGFPQSSQKNTENYINFTMTDFFPIISYPSPQNISMSTQYTSMKYGQNSEITIPFSTNRMLHCVIIVCPYAQLNIMP